VDIRPQPLRIALRKFAEQTNLQVLYSDTEVESTLYARGVKGEYSAEAAIRELLADVKLSGEFVNEKTIAIHASETGAASARARYVSEGTSAELNKRSNGKPRKPVEQSNSVSAQSVQRESQDAAFQDTLDEIVVTGTHLRGQEPVGSLVTIYSRKKIQQSGAATVEQFVRKMPQNFASVDASTPGLTNTGSTGFSQLGSNGYKGSSVNLHGLGANGTLVLLNGNRVGGAGGSGDFVDISLIPLSAIERVEVMEDGGSSTYGSDAIAGVVNFVLRKNFSGAETSLRYGSATRGGADELTVTQMFGHSWGANSAMLVYEFNRHNGLLSDERSFVPPQPLPLHIMPKQRRNSVFASANRMISDGMTATLDGYYSDREYVADMPGFLAGGFINQHTEGFAKQFGGTLGLSHALGRDWHANLSGNFSKTQQNFDVTFVGVPVPSTTGPTDIAVYGGELRADGSLLELPAGKAKAAVGVAFRDEKLDNNRPGKFKRRVFSTYGELMLPIVSEANAMPGLKRLDLAVSVRYDTYDDAGSSTNPKIGIAWTPVQGLKMRGSYSTSFRAPLFTQLVPTPNYNVLNLADASAPDGITTTLVDLSSGNPDLGPEEAKSFTAGIDVSPPAVPGFVVHATYFRTNYSGRIARPPVVGSLLSLYSQASALEPFIDRDPDPAVVQGLIDAGVVSDGRIPRPSTPLSGSSVESIFDFRFVNVAATKESGISLGAAYDLAALGGDWSFSLGGTYLLNLDYQSAATTPAVQLVNRLAQPMDLRLYSGISWSARGFNSSVLVNYWDKYENSFFNPAVSVGSWTTMDLQLSYEFGTVIEGSVLSGVTASLTAQNISDRKPPVVRVPDGMGLIDIGFDPPNASPLGRVVALQITKKW